MPETVVYENTIESLGRGKWGVKLHGNKTNLYEWLRPAAEAALTQGIESGADVITITIEKPVRI
jgi:hypothetical protein